MTFSWVQRKKTEETKPPRIVVTGRGIHSHAFIIGTCAALAVIVAAAAIWWHYQPNARQSNADRQRALQSSLSYALAHDDNQQVITNISQLISGKKSGIFTLSDATVSTYYLEQGSAMMNLHEYAKSMTAFQDGAKLGGPNTKAALQGQLFAGYRSGQRQQLIPILQQLATLAAKHPDPLGGVSSSHYEQQIQELQNNQELDL